jgi:hypothetical protein
MLNGQWFYNFLYVLLKGFKIFKNNSDVQGFEHFLSRSTKYRGFLHVNSLSLPLSLPPSLSFLLSVSIGTFRAL